ncbi:hypothetical protein TNIN_95571 [Trichonephila inaurata madagascariensis]|uniref:Uncharacterized protein n=1 Tax=Trichonephila inaurata madagascariensis TaxID=2747483 RepID=A0A8X6XJL5_9ARAC|nr:hypothetical protein TNIN_95571 [Trichonephila inaurata madagascariensis]
MLDHRRKRKDSLSKPFSGLRIGHSVCRKFQFPEGSCSYQPFLFEISNKASFTFNGESYSPLSEKRSDEFGWKLALVGNKLSMFVWRRLSIKCIQEKITQMFSREAVKITFSFPLG